MTEQPESPGDVETSRDTFITNQLGPYQDHDRKQVIFELVTVSGTAPVEFTRFRGVVPTNRGPLNFPIHADSIQEAHLRFAMALEDATRPKPEIVTAVALPAGLMPQQLKGRG